MLTVRSDRREPIGVHLRQSMLDGACAHHCVAMALVILGLMTRAGALNMAHRKNGVSAALYRALKRSWMEGLYAGELVEVLAGLNLPIAIEWTGGFDSGVDGFAVEALKRGRLVLMAYQSERGRAHRHWVLGVGCAGETSDRQLLVDSLLVLDPSVDELPFAIGNGVLYVPAPMDFGSRFKSINWTYESVDGAENVRLMSAISLTLRPIPSKRRH
ncbi:MAG: hypothetical protein EOP24_19075 [Hyphomicrobiales bacterium]|nr:MAG: hypothetical protein EOP24_19075 [Hyphomicrobiales bacterium]